MKFFKFFTIFFYFLIRILTFASEVSNDHRCYSNDSKAINAILIVMSLVMYFHALTSTGSKKFVTLTVCVFVNSVRNYDIMYSTIVK